MISLLENKEATSRRKKHSAYSPKSEIYPEPPIQCSPGCSKSLLETGFEEIFESKFASLGDKY